MFLPATVMTLLNALDAGLIVSETKESNSVP